MTEHFPPDSQATETLLACFANPEIRACFTQPTHPTTVWRERAFTDVPKCVQLDR